MLGYVKVGDDGLKCQRWNLCISKNLDQLEEQMDDVFVLTDVASSMARQAMSAL